MPLRHLAARILIGERAFAAVPRLTAAFRRSLTADGLGDYFLASVLLRLGEPIGHARVLDVLGSSRPDWAAEASADLDACLPDAAQTAADRAGFLREHAAKLSFDRASGRYSLPRADR